MPHTSAVYRPRNPYDSPYYQCVEDHFEAFEQVYFLYDRKLLSQRSRRAWESLKVFFREAMPQKAAVPGAVIAIQTFGDFPGVNPHCHILCTDDCFYGEGMFRVAPTFKLKDLEAIFRYKVFRMLLSKGKSTQDVIDMLMSWRHSGFNVFCGPRMYPQQQQAMENLARYIIRASFSQERMTYVPEEARVMSRQSPVMSMPRCT